MRHASVVSALLLTAGLVLTGCPPSTPAPSNNPPVVSWSLYDLATRQTQNVNGGGSPTVNIAPGDEYLVAFHANSPAGIQSLTLSGKGSVICNNNKPPFTESNPFTFSIGPTTITLTPPAGQVYTDGANPYGFIWNEVTPPGQPTFKGPTFPAFSQCSQNSNVPLLGTTTYTGTATTVSNVSSSPVQLKVTTCASPPCG
jgi:hypothetical protein